MVMGLLSPRGSKITSKTVAGADDTSAGDARAMSCFGVLLLLLRSGDRFQVGTLG